MSGSCCDIASPVACVPQCTHLAAVTGSYPGTPGCVIGEVGVGHECTQFSVSKGCVLTTHSLELLELRMNA